VVTLKRHYVNKNDMISFIFGFQLSNLNFIISVMKHFNLAQFYHLCARVQLCVAVTSDSED
jgi:hypothetical protein